MKRKWPPDELMFMKNQKADQKKSVTPMTGKTCVITGATSGVGLEAAKQFAQSGARIVMVCRNSEKAHAVRAKIMRQWDVPVDIVLADFSRLDEVRKAAAKLLSDYPRIDVLVNNAGLHSTRRIETPEGFELVFLRGSSCGFLVHPSSSRSHDRKHPGPHPDDQLRRTSIRWTPAG